MLLPRNSDKIPYNNSEESFRLDQEDRLYDESDDEVIDEEVEGDDQIPNTYMPELPHIQLEESLTLKESDLEEIKKLYRMLQEKEITIGVP